MRDLREWIDKVEEINELYHVTKAVDWNLELSTIVRLNHEISGPALLFENVKDSLPGSRVLTNPIGMSTKRYAVATYQPVKSDIPALMHGWRERIKKKIPPKKVDGGPIRENILTGNEIDLSRFPTPKWWPFDGGRYIGTHDVVITKDADSDWVNLGTYRNMILDKDKLGFWVSHGHHARIIRERWWAKGKPCPVAITFGQEPAFILISGRAFPVGESELDYVGGLRGEAVEVIEGEETGLPIPAHAEIAIEGYSYPDVTMEEGPFGESQGYYSKPKERIPYIEVKRLYYRNNPILCGAQMGSYPSDSQGLMGAIGRAAGIWEDLERAGVKGITRVWNHPQASGGMMTVVSIKQLHAGHAKQVACLAAQVPQAAYHNKYVIVVDDDINIFNLGEVMWALTTRVDLTKDVDLVRDTWGTYLEPSIWPVEDRPYSSTALINACKPHKWIDQFPKRNLPDPEVKQKVIGRWKELGLPGDPSKLA